MIPNTPTELLHLFIAALVAGGGWRIGGWLVDRITTALARGGKQ